MNYQHSISRRGERAAIVGISFCVPRFVLSRSAPGLGASVLAIFKMKMLLFTLLILVTSGGFAQEFRDEDWSRELFAGDIICPFDEQTPYQGSERSYLDPATLPKDVRATLQALKPGLTRAGCVGWGMNSNLSMNEYCHGLLPSGKSLAVRMVFRPAAMPEAVFSNQVARQAWIHDHPSDATPTDILMRFSQPFATTRGID